MSPGKIRVVFFIALLLQSFQIARSQNISEKFFGQSAWMPFSIGSTIYNGKLDSQWKKVKDSRANIIRYGGVAVDNDKPSHLQYLSIIDSIRSNGMEPVMLVSFYNNKYTASQAAETVEFVNIASNRNVKYWVIGNEPDNSYGYVNSSQVADYIRKFSLAMKNKDSTIKIIAPETSWYNKNILDGLTTPGGINDITGKDSFGNFIVDIISFHNYPFRGTQKRSQVISYLSAPGHFEDDLSELNQRIESCNSFHQRNSNSPLQIAVTEANIAWKNSNGDNIFGLGTNSFLGGQFWAEMIGICMKKNVNFINFWSVIEGNELGYLNHSTTLPKPSYFHFQMIAENFKGSYCLGKDSETNIKSFGSKNDDQISVIIMNQDQSNNFIYTLRLDTTLISGTNPLKINIDAGTNIEYSDTIFSESSVVLIFNSVGTLIKKCVYQLYGNADQGFPPTCIINPVIPIPPKTTESFAVIGDFGLSGPNEAAVANLVKSWNPDYIITVGDNNYELGQSSTIDANIGQYYHEYIYPYSGNYGAAADSNRFFPALGNHDLDTDNGSAYLQYFTLPGNERYYDYIKGNIHFFVLNSDPREAHGVDSNSIQSLWLKDKLQNSKSKWNLVYFHHPPYCSERDHGSQEYMQWPFKRWGADIVLSGHSHVYERLIVDSFPYIVNGVGGKSLHPFNPASLPETILRYNSDYGAMLCNEYSDTLSFRFYNKGGTLIDSYLLIKKQIPLSVVISAPLNNSTFSFGTLISINANVVGGQEGIRVVDFFADTLKLGSDSIFPYSFSWNNAEVGNYSLTVKATDSIGNSAVSEIINITVYTIIPLTAAIISPANNASFNADSTITIQATAAGGTGSIQKVEFFAGTILLAEDTLAPYSFLWNNAEVGNYSLTVKATDSIGNSAVSEIINITVYTIIPLTAAISSPANNASFNSDSTITIQATVSGGTGSIQKVEFFAGTIQLAEDTLAPYTFLWNNAEVGNYSLTVKATDSTGNSAVSEIINITVYAIIPLTAAIISPANNATFNSDSTITIQASASGGTGSIQKVEFFAGTIQLAEDTLAPYSFLWNNAEVGNYSLTVKATDSTGNSVVSEIINITVYTIIPLTAAISSPANNASFNSDSTITIQATVSGGTGSIQKVEFFAGTIQLAEDTLAPYTFLWNNAEVGNYSLTVKATDSTGNSAVSEIINITVYAIIPLTAAIISPANNASFNADSTITIQATAAGGTGSIQKVEFFAGTILLAEDTLAPYSFLWNNAEVGNYSLTVKATDSIGNSAVSEIINITVYTIIPLTAAISSPANNASFNSDSTITIQATVSGGTGSIQKVEFFAGTILLAEDTLAPYFFSWNNADVGNYSLTVKATDSIGNSAVSEIINITVYAIIPLTAAIISPANNATFNADSTITIQATAEGGTGSIQKVEFFAGLTKLGEDTSSPYSFIWNNAGRGNYELTAKVSDSLNTAVSAIVTITVNSNLICNATGTITREVWSNISGTSVSAIPLNSPASLTGELSIFEAPAKFADNYGQRIRGFICPPATGNYTFWIASDDNSELWLSTDDNPANRQKIAYVTGYTSSRQWTKYTSQKSALKNLTAGQNYYIEALHKEGSKSDHCAVGWQIPSGVLERPIPGNRLSPVEIIPPTPSIELISAGSSWKYLDNGSDQGTAWRETAFSDATWKTGNAELGYGDGGEATVVSYGTSSTNKYITTYFRKTFNVTDQSTISGLELSLIRDDGAAVYINGVEVYRNNLPSGMVFYNTLAPTYIDGANESTYVIANLSASALVDGTNVIAVEIHQNARTSSDISFNLKLKTLSGSRILDISNPNDSILQNSIPDNTVEMIVYPNPNTGKFNLEFCIDGLGDKPVLIEITNTFGQVVYERLPQKINGCINEAIELESDLPTGIYILKVTIDGKTQTAKMLLTR